MSQVDRGGEVIDDITRPRSEIMKAGCRDQLGLVIAAAVMEGEAEVENPVDVVFVSLVLVAYDLRSR